MYRGTAFVLTLALLISAVVSNDAGHNQRLALITAGPRLAPRQELVCPAATATPCPDGNGCCPRGYACTTVTGKPRCDQPCGFDDVMCASGGCCEPGYACGVSGCISTGHPTLSLSLPSFSIPSIPTFSLPDIPDLPSFTPPRPTITSPPRSFSTPTQQLSMETAEETEGSALTTGLRAGGPDVPSSSISIGGAPRGTKPSGVLEPFGVLLGLVGMLLPL